MREHGIHHVGSNSRIRQRNNFIGIKVESRGTIGDIVLNHGGIHARLRELENLRDGRARLDAVRQRAAARGWRHRLRIDRVFKSGSRGDSYGQSN